LAFNAVFYQNGQQLIVAPMFALYNGAAASGGFLWHGIGLASPCNGVELVVTRSVLNKTKRF